MNSTAKVESARTPGSSGGIKRAVCLACGSEMISIETDGTRDELVAALSEFTGENLSDVRALADKLHQNNHRVTGTEAERISYLLHYLERSTRVARAALAKAQP